MILEKSYRRYLEGKRVCFIGPAPNLIGKGKGKWIDKFDVVIRTNHAIELLADDDYRKDYGSKCNILYINIQYYREMRPFPIERWKLYGLDWLCMKKCYPLERRGYRQFVKVRQLTNTMLSMAKMIPSVLMGTMIISEISMCNVKEFYVDGIDFNISRPKIWDNAYPEYIDGYLPEKIIEKAKKINVGKTDDGHDFKKNTNLVYNIYKKGKVNFPKNIELLINNIVEGKACQV